MEKFRSRKEKAADIANVFFLIVIALVMLFPFYYMIVVSFTPYSEYVRHNVVLWPRQWSWDAYSFIFHSRSFVRSLGVTVWITVAGSLFSLALTSMMAYPLTRNIFGQRFFMFMVLFTFVFGAGMIPTYLVVKATHLIDSFWALIIPTAISSFNLIVLRQFMLGIPKELIEAAVMDGANEGKVFRKIIIPLSKPALAAFGLFYAVTNWNTYFNALLFINNPEKWPIQVILRQIVILNQSIGISDARQTGMIVNPPPPETIGMAAILIATLPILVLYPFLQKHFAKGVMLGSVKG
ncbi:MULTISPECIES: carbohydrate ABC transporter permease [unclassified Paenibacillus]|uniref:carbohydrate ABC transporter permease n=1 Tax=unclassified Paenibacillus TaxID=185978 RepID=UPI00095644D5|nr:MULTISPECIES: carbohydrate ABC transporter permease [unclassified Paenibacillus]ASS66146.1 carbohydrate ABC transporter permease [Paenibacillus sp. RUD330]SIQ11299.1 putative aldouronate transport system permease protein [Paenibacillus sp. RU4X]SIQ32429.1 putative aldouronate transport system permease protein [Paenibacillus sp. RU4T]